MIETSTSAFENWPDTVEAFKRLVVQNKVLSLKKHEENEEAFRQFEAWLNAKNAQ